MGRPKKPVENVMIDMPLKVMPDTASHIEQLAIRLERSKSFINRKLLLRGLAAYLRDNLLEEVNDFDIRDSDLVFPAPKKQRSKRKRREMNT